MQSDRKICGYCQSAIKSETETFYCPGCKTPYHKDCWSENKGCAVYGCNEKAEIGIKTEISVEDMYVNIEYFINERRYTDAITEAKRILEADKDSIKAKRYYNKAVALVNNKTKLLEDADALYGRGDFKGAEIYYRNAMQFLSDDERGVIDARVEHLRQKIPMERKRKRIGNVLVALITIVIIAATAYLGYYYIVLKEDREYAEIEKEDNFKDVKIMEMQLSQYNRFAMKYKDGRNYEKATDKISLLAGILADSLAKSDWREARKFLSKVDKDRNAKTYNDVYNKIYSLAAMEFNTSVSNARKLNAIKKYIDAKKMTEHALEIIKDFPESPLAEQKDKLNQNVGILTRKISTLLKYDNIQAEIDEKVAELRKYGLPGSGIGGNPIINAVIEEKPGNGIVLARLSDKGTLVALKSGDFGFRLGEYVSVEAERDGIITIDDGGGNDIQVPLYIPVKADVGMADISSERYARESLLQRLEYLKSQKSKLDSILTIKLL